jgi:formylglycine-generating enzyme required for sulfatase activity
VPEIVAPALEVLGLEVLDVGDPWYPKDPHAEQVAASEVLGIPLAVRHRLTQIGLILIPGGRFWMGADPDDADATDAEMPRRQLTIDPFYAGITPVTQAAWQLAMGSAPSEFTGSDRPVESVSWVDVQGFLASAAREGGVLRLPTESEWEYAARGGQEGRYWWGSQYEAGQACCDDAAVGGKTPTKTAPVGQFPANPFGLHDALGSVYEWVADSWHPSYRGAPSDGSAWGGGTDARARVVRGGSWYHRPANLRVSYRDPDPIDFSFFDLGFRCALSIPSADSFQA